jgi:hypothetical protein
MTVLFDRLDQENLEKISELYDLGFYPLKELNKLSGEPKSLVIIQRKDDVDVSEKLLETIKKMVNMSFMMTNIVYYNGERITDAI